MEKRAQTVWRGREIKASRGKGEIGTAVMTIIRKYIYIWFLFAKNAFQEQMSTTVSAVFFFIGKMFRFIMFLYLLLMLSRNSHSMAGYSIDQIIIFFMTFNIIDVLSQMFLRGVYMFQSKVRTGEFDYILIKPVNALFRSLTGSPDFNDFLKLIPLIGYFAWYLNQMGRSDLPVNLANILVYLLLVVNGLLIATALHIFVLCIGILTQEVDNAIWLYRDFSQMGRFPVDIYREPLRWFITFIIPVGIMISVPAKVLMGEMSNLVFISFGVGIASFVLALWSWDKAVKSYTSASS